MDGCTDGPVLANSHTHMLRAFALGTNVGSSLEGSSLEGSSLEGSSLEGSSLEGSSLEGSSLEDYGGIPQ